MKSKLILLPILGLYLSACNNSSITTLPSVAEKKPIEALANTYWVIGTYEPHASIIKTKAYFGDKGAVTFEREYQDLLGSPVVVSYDYFYYLDGDKLVEISKNNDRNSISTHSEEIYYLGDYTMITKDLKDDSYVYYLKCDSNYIPLQNGDWWK